MNGTANRHGMNRDASQPQHSSTGYGVVTAQPASARLPNATAYQSHYPAYYSPRDQGGYR